ncbi:hypothetical protein GC176_25005 [bacterium]|nr:hypothetical protein [bacterium]
MKPASGTFVFTLGILVAISGAAKPPAEGEAFPDTFPVFIAGFLAAVAGVEIWWGNRSITRQLTSNADHEAPDNPFVILRQLVPALQEFSARAEALDPADIEHQVDDLTSRYITPFVEGRQAVIDRLGLQKGADFLVTAATGERLLNRVWSAAADGHLEEALTSLAEAVGAFEQAQQQIAAE